MLRHVPYFDSSGKKQRKVLMYYSKIFMFLRSMYYCEERKMTLFKYAREYLHTKLLFIDSTTLHRPRPGKYKNPFLLAIL